jgi:ABC-type multidrug transport system ATPase subunit
MDARNRRQLIEGYMSSQTIQTPATLISPAGPRQTLAVRAAGLSKSIDGRAVLRLIDLELPAGTCCALMGSNGAGKTTLLKLLSTAQAPSKGSLELFGRAAAPVRQEVRRRIGFIGHQSMLYRDLTCIENLLLFGRLYRVPQPLERAGELLEQVGMSDRAHDRVSTLSRGMLQRIAIARALMHDPDLLLADEPFMGLDTASAARLERCLLDLRSAGKTIVFSDHAVQHALGLSDRMVVLLAGVKVLDQPSIELDAGDVLHAMEEVR